MSAAPLSPIALRRIADAIEAGDAQTADFLRRLVLPPSRFAERDRLVVECLQRFFGGCSSLRDASEEMAAQLGRYHATPWLNDNKAKTCPPRIAGTVKGAFWLILKTVERPLSAERIRKLVGQFEVTQAARDETDTK